jgi:disulfide bond formation protein DsbB
MKLFFLAHLLVCILLLLLAVSLQRLLQLSPCDLCIHARYVYVAAALSALLGFCYPKKARVYLLLCGSIYVASAGLAIFHSGIELQLWQGFSSCSSSITATTIEQLRAALAAVPIVRCDAVQWQLFGLSMANYNAVLSLVFAGHCLYFLLRRKKDAKSL